MNKLQIIIFWGALWGVLEATLGWVLHLTHFKAEVWLLYPFGLLCMLMAFSQTRQSSSLVQVALVAAAIKLVNLFFAPAVPLFHVLNPAVGIALEGLASWAFCLYFKRSKSHYWAAIPLASLLLFSSMVAFRGWQIVMHQMGAPNPSLSELFPADLLLQWCWRAAWLGLFLFGLTSRLNRYQLTFHFTRFANQLAFPLLVIALLLNHLIS